VGALTHVALFTWKAGTTEQDVDLLCQGLAALPGLIPEIRAYRFGPDAGLNAGNAEFGIVAEFDDVDAYRVYAAHPAHRDVLDRLVAPIVDRRTAVQLAG
jgi:stress responsive alpha/beta barrel protein